MYLCLLFYKAEALDAFKSYKVKVEKKIYHKVCKGQIEVESIMVDT
jgi:hypothetical protein